MLHLNWWEPIFFVSAVAGTLATVFCLWDAWRERRILPRILAESPFQDYVDARRIIRRHIREEVLKLVIQLLILESAIVLLFLPELPVPQQTASWAWWLLQWINRSLRFLICYALAAHSVTSAFERRKSIEEYESDLRDFGKGNFSDDAPSV